MHCSMADLTGKSTSTAHLTHRRSSPHGHLEAGGRNRGRQPSDLTTTLLARAPEAMFFGSCCRGRSSATRSSVAAAP